MIAYHLVWDLGFLKLTAASYATTPGGRVAARVIAGSFLAIVGISLVLASRGGLRPRAYLIRLAKVAGAALAVTVVTWAAFPDSYIFFGILHEIAVSSVLALPFLAAPLWVVPVAAVCAMAAPLFLREDAFDAPALVWLGLGTRTPVTNDFVPLLPWFGMVLVGVALARGARLRGAGRLLERLRGDNRLARVLAWAGRRSLLIYLVHQPLLLAVLYPLAAAVGPHPEADANAFRDFFESSCERRGEGAPTCRAAAACLEARLRAADLWAATLANELPSEEQERARAFSRECFQRAKGEPALGP